MRGEFHKLADFNDVQVANFEERLGTFHVWHRQYELPKYAALVKTISERAVEPGAIDAATIQSWMNKSETFTQSIRECHPINFSFDLMNSLTDKQFHYIERRFRSEQRKNQEKYYSRTVEERIQRRTDNIVKFAARIGFDFTEGQTKLLKQTFTQQKSLRQDYWTHSGNWNRRFFKLARQQDVPNYNDRMEAHLNTLWTLLEKAKPIEWQQNRNLWRAFGVEFFNSMNKDQRKWANSWLGKMSETIVSISKAEPSATPSDSSSVGCYADASSSSPSSL